MLLSIIIPVYNADSYLERCLESVFKAVALSKVSTEVIVVDNGSTDESMLIAEKFQKTSPLRVKICYCKEEGAAAARNYGVKKALGKYLWFIDADDAIAEESVRDLVQTAEKSKADITMMGAERIYNENEKNYLSAIDPEAADYKSRFVRYGAGPWQFLFLREWWKTHKFAFKEGIIHEDMEMISSLILYTNKFASVDEPLYFYYQNQGSVLHKDTWDPHQLDIFEALRGLYERFKEKKAARDFHDELEWFFIWNLLIDSYQEFKRFPEGKEGLKFSREMLKKYFPKWRKNRFLREKPLKLRIRVRLNYRKK